MQESTFNEIQERLRAVESETAKVEARGLAPKPIVELTPDLSVLRVFVEEAIKQLEAGGKSRPRSLAITKLQEAGFWIMEEMRTS